MKALNTRRVMCAVLLLLAGVAGLPAQEMTEQEIQDLVFKAAEGEIARRSSELRQWTGRNGQVIEAFFVGISDDGHYITLRTADNRTIKTETDNLIETDQRLAIDALVLKYVRRRQQAQSAFEAGNKYYSGTGVNQDFGRAIAYYRNAAALRDIPDLVLDYFGDFASLLTAPFVNANVRLGYMYSQGLGVPRDNNKSIEFYREAATRGHIGAQSNLGLLLKSVGNEEEAIFWFRKAAEANLPEAIYNLAIHEQDNNQRSVAADYFMRAGIAFLERDNREGALRCLDRLQEVGATALAAALGERIYQPAAPSGSPPPERSRGMVMGTGWFCTPTHIVTACHVLAGKETFYVSSEQYPKIPVRLVARDRKNDLAILELLNADSANSRSLPLASGRASTGDQVFTVGFPHIDFLGKAPKYTDGTVSAVSGIGDDPRILQISVPVQSGNSGGPLLNATGEVVGVVASKLAAERVLAWTGDLPQNVNFAVKVDYLRPLLESHAVRYSSESGEAKTLSRPDLVKRIEAALVMVTAE